MNESESALRRRPKIVVAKRLVLWLLPLITAAALLLGWRRADEQTTIDRARELLLAGDAEAAASRLDTLRTSLWVGAEAETGLLIARAFEDDRAAQLAPTRLDSLAPDAYPLPLMIRAAFERGDFGSALRLTDLAHALGRPTVPLLTTAAMIEAGQAVSPNLVGEPLVESLLATRLRQHLRASPETTGSEARPRILDRFDRVLGHLDNGELIPAARVRPELLPRTLTELSDSHPSAASLRSSLDLELAEAAFGAFGRYRGSIVLLDPYSGEILAAVSDRRTFDEGGTAAFEQFREPASISKLITTAAYLRDGGDPDRRLRQMRCRGHESYAGERLYCPVIAGPLRGLDRAMAVSCNVAFANLAVEIGRPRLLEELRRFGFGRDLGPFPGGRILESIGDDRQLADLAIGLDDTEITPLHAAMIAAIIANGGHFVEPSLLSSTDGRLGLHPRPIAKGPTRQVIDSEWIGPLRNAMTAVVEKGTAKRIRTPGFPVAMKTGTASHPNHGFHVNYIGFGPLPEARIAFSVRITHRGTSRHVRRAASEVTGRLLRKLRSISRQRGWQNGSAEPPSLLASSERLYPSGSVRNPASPYTDRSAR